MYKYFLIVLLTTGCITEKPPLELTEVKTFTLEDFPARETLTGQKYRVEGLIDTERILDMDNCLVISGRNSDTLIHVIDKKTMKIVNSMGIKGRGPGEIILPNTLFRLDENTYVAFEAFIRRLHYFDLQQTVPLAKKTISSSDKMRQSWSLILSSDTTILATTESQDAMFVEYDLDGEELNSYGSWKDAIDEDIPIPVISNIHLGSLTTNKERTYFSNTCVAVDRIDLLDKRNKKLISIRGPEQHIMEYEISYDNSGNPRFAVRDANKVRIMYTNTHLGEDYIFALYSGAFPAEIYNGSKYCNDIFVFTYSGDPVMHYTLDTSISRFTINESENKIYGISLDADSSIVAFDYSPNFNLPEE